jgi:hypothetical protein
VKAILLIIGSIIVLIGAVINLINKEEFKHWNSENFIEDFSYWKDPRLKFLPAV